jgi:hypothetical protein
MRSTQRKSAASSPPNRWRAAALATAALAALTAAAAGAQPAPVAHSAAAPTTLLISRSLGGGVPNGPSTHAVISNDKRFARAIAFQSDASDLTRRDGNSVSDVYAVRRAGSIGNNGSLWKPGKNVLISRTPGGAAGNGPSFSPSIDGSFHSRPSCVGFLSEASNLVSGDTNGQTDAFVGKLKGGAPRRVSKPGGRQSSKPTTAVAVSGDCKSVAFVTGGKLYVSKGGRKAKQVRARGTAADPSFSTGVGSDLVFGASGGVYLAKNGTGHPKLVGRGGRNPVYNDIKRQTVAYEKRVGGHTQIAYHDIGKRERIISADGGSRGNGDSTEPVIGNSGFYVTFQSKASNLQTNAGSAHADQNGLPDVYLYTDTRKITLVQSVQDKGVPLDGGGANPSMSFYANYIVFDTPSRISSGVGDRQIFMRYVGGL